MKKSIKRLTLAFTATILAGCAPAPLDPVTLPPPLASRLTPAKPLTKSKQGLIIGKWDTGEGPMELMRGGHFRLRMNDGSFIDSTGRPPQGVGGTQRGKVLPGSARWALIESPQGDRLCFNVIANNPHGYANPNLGGAVGTLPVPRAVSFELEILFVNDDCFICRAAGKLAVCRRLP